MNNSVKVIRNISLILFGISLIAISCKQIPVSVTRETEVLPEDIVEMREDQIKLAEIELGKIEMQSLGNVLKVNGIISVAPQNLATVCMPLGGFIKNTSLLPGNQVTRGQVLAVVDNQEFVDVQQAYLEAKNKLAFSEADFKRHTDLYKSDVYSEQNVQQVTVEYRNLKALVRSLEQKLILIGIVPEKLKEENISSTVSLVSPIDGFLKSVNINIGKYVSPTEVLFEIVNNDKLFLTLTLFEKDADKVATGQKVKFYINNETEMHEAVISQTGKSVGSDRSYMVYATVSSQCKNLLPGMYVNALILESDLRVTALPSDAVVSFDDKDYIFTYEKDKEEAGKAFTEYRMIEVKKGVSDSGYTEIRLPDGFNISSTRVVTKGAYSLLSAKKNAGEMAC
jgi:cobalt-zinc-cadmium efflux system membrane fusion protein